MNPKEAAKVIGCSPQHVRTLIRKDVIKAKRRETKLVAGGYVYEITECEVLRYRDSRPNYGRGFPRGQKRKAS